MMSRRKRRALELLAVSEPNGRVDSLFVARFTGELLDLVRDGLATARREPLGSGRLKVEVVRIRITDAGRRAIDDPVHVTQH
jgi:hypothetical protein